jgi:hypothetical protein
LSSTEYSCRRAKTVSSENESVARVVISGRVNTGFNLTFGVVPEIKESFLALCTVNKVVGAIYL